MVFGGGYWVVLFVLVVVIGWFCLWWWLLLRGFVVMCVVKGCFVCMMLLLYVVVLVIHHMMLHPLSAEATSANAMPPLSHRPCSRSSRRATMPRSFIAVRCATVLSRTPPPPRADLKPENWLLTCKMQPSDEVSPEVLRAIDFGLSVFLQPGQRLRQLAGSSFYIAPEVLKGSYGFEADLWSAGVIIYILLSGLPPFWGSSEKQIFRR